MQIKVMTLWLPKDGNTSEEYEDAANPMEATELETEEFRCAIADGATETSFAGRWAKLLVDGYIKGLDLEELRNSWNSEIEHKDLPWYASEKAQMGAFSTLLGLTIFNDQKWEAKAVGDSCLMHANDEEKVLTIFPLSKSDQFDNSPLLLPTATGKGPEIEFKQHSGEWKVGDCFILMTDAIACWMLKRHEEFADVIKQVAAIKDQQSLEWFAQAERSAKDSSGRPLMRNDDVTLMTVSLQ